MFVYICAIVVSLISIFLIIKNIKFFIPTEEKIEMRVGMILFVGFLICVYIFVIVNGVIKLFNGV
jgi:hypothetical protein